MRKVLAVLAVALVVGVGVGYLASYAPLEQTGRGRARRRAGAIRPWPAAPAPPALPAPPLGPVCGGHCGVERWTVKTLSEPDRDAGELTPVDATVEQLAALRVSYPPPGHDRGFPAELTTYRVEALLTRVFTEDDQDWHLVLQGLHDHRASIIAEIPDPQCAGACRSGLAADYARARAAVEEHAPVEGHVAHADMRRHPVRVRVTGIGFFDPTHGQAGVAPNGIELHPVLRIEFPQ